VLNIIYLPDHTISINKGIIIVKNIEINYKKIRINNYRLRKCISKSIG
jgi:hypothetical protein